MRHAAPLALLALALVAAPASAVPILHDANMTLSIEIVGVGTYTRTAAGQVTVDDMAGTVALAAGAFSATGVVAIPVTATTSIGSLTAGTLSNQAGAFFLGGATDLCPPSPGEACVDGTGLGGAMGLSGTLNVHILTSIVVIPIGLDSGFGLGGTIDTGATGDAASWTTGVGRILTSIASAAWTTTGSATANSFNFVSPAAVYAVGNSLPVLLRFEIALVPEPGAALLLTMIGCAGLLALRRGGS
ncbi:MAG: hypothetical protein HKP30_15135 [Myxococcales bacterium]|nr:hypothetical protein [Myxococcales bacterium]